MSEMKMPFWWVTMLKPRPWPGFLTKSAVTVSYMSSSTEGSSRRTTRVMIAGVWRSVRIAFSWVMPSRLSPQTYTVHTCGSLLMCGSGRTVPPAQLLWPTGFLCGWSVGLEFPAGQLAGFSYWREQFQTISEDVFVRNILMHSVH